MSIKDKIIEDIQSYQKSYKFVLYKAFFELSSNGEVDFDELANYFKSFYLERKKKEKIVEDNDAKDLIKDISPDTSLTKIKTHLKNLPVKYNKYLSLKDEKVFMEQEYWNQLSDENIEDIIENINETIETYYQGVKTMTDVVEPQNIFLVIGDDTNYRRTIEKSIDINEVKDILSEKDYNNLINIYPSGKIQCWGFQDNQSKNRCWDNMRYGDLCLMYYNSKIVMSGTVTYTLHNADLAEEIWVQGDKPFEYIFCLNDVHILEIPSESVLVEEFHYKTGYLLGATALAKEKFNKLLEEYGSIANFRKHIEGDQYKEIEMEEEQVVRKTEEVLLEKYDPTEVLEGIKQYIQTKGFSYPEGLIENFYLSLKTKPFVLLAGISGTGKTKLVELFAEAIGCTRENQRFELISVRPDWNDSTDLLGYKNIQDKFVQGPLVDVIKRANDNPDAPYIVCLDEMNLARVEYYFSDFLSKMETRKFKDGRIVTTELLAESDFEEEDIKGKKYSGLYISDNLYIVGTVNMDETTHPFSKKVLDRANTIEFSEIDLGINANSFDKFDDIEPCKINNQFLKSQYIILKDCIDTNLGVVHEVTNYLIDINNILKKANLHVGYRIRDELCFYMSYAAQNNILEFDTAFDYQLMQKILPRIQGSSTLIKEVLVELFEYFGGSDISTRNDNVAKAMFNQIRSGRIQFPLTAQKLAFMVERLEADGFTAYWL